MVSLLVRRVLFLPLQAVGVVTIVFVLIHLLPGDPAALIAGPQATRAQIDHIRAAMGLDQPLVTQYVRYIARLIHGDLGTSWYTGNPVVTDIAQRGPATLELITLALAAIAILGIIVTGGLMLGTGGLAHRIVSIYGFLAGAVPDFWLGLALVFILYSVARIGPSPTGQISSTFAIPVVTGVATIDSLIAGSPAAFRDAIAHLILPVTTLVLVYLGPVVRVTSVAASRVLKSDFIRYAESWGIAPWRRSYYALRLVLPIFVTSLASVYGYLLGGAVLVETVFSWGGFGQYAVQAVTHADYSAIQGFVVVSGIFTVLIYALADILDLILDPRARPWA
jgi:ABC-type dipeptide/oligopeptide/nickel transport system permease component